MTSWMRKPATLGLSLGVTLMASVLGCGGEGDHGDVVVVPDSTVGSSPAGKTSAAAAPGSTAPAAATPTASAPAAAAPVKAEGYGTLKGQVTFAGDPPAPKVLFEKGKAAKDPEVCAKDAPLLSERLVVDGGTNGVKNVLVYLNKPTSVSDEAKKAAAAANVLFDQNKCVFDPHVLGILTGSPITLKSSDPVNHNVNAKLKQAGFNQLLAPQSSTKFTPAGPERTPAEVTCDIHPWMKAWWMVLDHPYFAVTDAKGYFEIKNAPAGTQKVVVWQEAVDKNGFVTAPSGDEVVIKANDSVVKDFKVEPSRLRAE
jgi:plastocyanin